MNSPSLKRYVAVWIGLMFLLALTCGTSFIPLGRLNLIINLGVAVAKALLVMLVYMRLRSAAPMVWVAAVAGFFFLAILVSLSATDFALQGG